MRLRITCDAKYPKIATEIENVIRVLFPNNKVSRIYRAQTYFDISVYSNLLREWMPWQHSQGTKLEQNAHVPQWVLANSKYTQQCLRGLIQTDGCIYFDRGYKMVNFTSNGSALAEDVRTMLNCIGFRTSFAKIRIGENRYKYTVRVAYEVAKLLTQLRLYKA